MIYTKDEEIELVKANLAVFEGRLPVRYATLLLKKALRVNQHGLFFSLCNPAIYPFLLKALQAIRKYDKPNMFPKAISKLTRNLGHTNQQAAVAEVIVAGYYCRKYLGHPKITVVWERVIPTSGKKMDVSLLGYKKPVNIEITAKDRDKRIRDFYDLRYKVKVALEQKIETLVPQKFCYIFSIFTEEKDGEQFVSDFTEKHIARFVKFVCNMRQDGEGRYYFVVSGKRLAIVEIRRLNKLKQEFASQMDMWSGFMKDEKRLRNRIVDKASNQLPQDEINFIYIPNLAGLDDIDFQEAFLGKEQWHLNKKGDVVAKTRKANGAVSVIHENKYSPVHGLFYSGWNYSKKKLIRNPLVSYHRIYEQLLN